MMTIRVTDVRAHPGDSAFLLDDGRTALTLDGESRLLFTVYHNTRIRTRLKERPFGVLRLVSLALRQQGGGCRTANRSKNHLF